MRNEVLNYLFSVGNSVRGVKNFEKFLDKIGNPHLDFKSIHVLGTNGKGSTTMILKQLLIGANYNVASFTSPTVKIVYDRIQVNSNNICEEEFAEIFLEIIDLTKEYKLGFFEILTAIAFIYFSRSNIDYAIIEAGIGGLNDCTSYVKCDVRLLTNIGLDHTNILGGSLDMICLQKLGALNSNEHLITTVDKNMHSLVTEYCNSRSISFQFVDSNISYELSLKGNHQKKNASLALACINFLRINLDDTIIKNALLSVEWPGRLQQITRNVLIDGAHNISGLEACLNFCNEYYGKNNYSVVFSCLKDKDANQMYNTIKESAKDVVFTTFSFDRAYTESELEKFSFNTNKDYRGLLREALSCKENYLFVGSLYFIYDILKTLEEDEIDFK